MLSLYFYIKHLYLLPNCKRKDWAMNKPLFSHNIHIDPSSRFTTTSNTSLLKPRTIFSFERFGLIAYQCTYAVKSLYSTHDGPLIINNHYTGGPFCQGLTPLRAKILRINIPIFIPAIEDHLNVLLYKARAETDSGLKNGRIPKWADSKFCEVSVSRLGAEP